MDYSISPAINATLNGSSAILLVLGRVLIARGRVAAHRTVMITASVRQQRILISYLTYHIGRNLVALGLGPFPRRRVVTPGLLHDLISHTILAVVIVPLVLDNA